MYLLRLHTEKEKKNHHPQNPHRRYTPLFPAANGKKIKKNKKESTERELVL